MNPEFGTLDPDVAEAVATAETIGSGNNPKVIGKGIYLELISKDELNAFQLLVTPEGMSENGKPTSMSVIFRTLNEWSPRRQWRVNVIRPEKTATTPKEIETNLLEQVEKYLVRQTYYLSGYTVRQTPIVFEVSNLDLNDIVDWKAPAPALRRIQKARLSLGFPELPYKTTITK